MGFPRMKVRTVFMGTPQFAVTILSALVESSHPVVGVYTQPDRFGGRGHKVLPSPVKQAAEAYRIPVVQVETFKSGDAIEQLVGFNPELIVVAAFGLILPPEVLSLPRFGCINVHASLLPRHRGPSPVASAILCGDEFSGVTIMLMDEGVDTGKILAQKKVRILPDDTTGTLTVKLAGAGAQLLLEVLPRWLRQEITPQPQDESQATYTRLITSEDGEIDWHLPAVELWRSVRAYNPWPGCYTWYKGKRFKIHQAFPRDKVVQGQLGQVVALGEPGRVGVVTGCGILELHEVQLEGRRRMGIGDFVNGERQFVGSILGKK